MKNRIKKHIFEEFMSGELTKLNNGSSVNKVINYINEIKKNLYTTDLLKREGDHKNRIRICIRHVEDINIEDIKSAVNEMYEIEIHEIGLELLLEFKVTNSMIIPPSETMSKAVYDIFILLHTLDELTDQFKSLINGDLDDSRVQLVDGIVRYNLLKIKSQDDAVFIRKFSDSDKKFIVSSLADIFGFSGIEFKTVLGYNINGTSVPAYRVSAKLDPYDFFDFKKNKDEEYLENISKTICNYISDTIMTTILSRSTVVENVDDKVLVVKLDSNIEDNILVPLIRYPKLYKQLDIPYLYELGVKQFESDKNHIVLFFKKII